MVQVMLLRPHAAKPDLRAHLSTPILKAPLAKPTGWILRTRIMSLEDYKVTLDAFEGPLDLLLYLIRRDEIHLHDIPVAAITTSFLNFLEHEGGISRIDVDLAAEFLVMAATLMEIKSRTLTPEAFAKAENPENETADKPQDDPRADLVRQLMAYKKFRDAASALERRHEQWVSRFGAGPASWTATSIDDDEQVHLEDVSIVDLCEAFAAIMEAVDFTRLGDHTVKDDETPIQVHAADIVDLLRHHFTNRAGESDANTDASVEFAKVFAGRTRSEAIGLFLAMLELIRQRQIIVQQEAIHGTIGIRLRDEADDAAEVALKPEDLDKRKRRKKVTAE